MLQNKYRTIEDFKEIYHSKSILYALIKRDLFGRYKNSVMGFLWHFIMPTILLAIYYVVFTGGIRINTIDNYLVYLASGIFPFTFMTSNLSNGAGCIVRDAGMVKKMYFPREIIPLAHVTGAFVIMIIGYTIVFTYIAVSGFVLNIVALLTLVPILLLEYLFVLGYTFLFSSITVYVRDMQYLLSSINIIFFFATPMYFMTSDTNGLLSQLIWLNPFTYFVESIHQVIYFGNTPTTTMWVGCVLLSTVSLFLGYLLFKKLKRGFAERL